MKNRICPFFLCFGFAISLFSQDFSINGSVEDLEKTPIAFANIQLLSRTDSTLINGTSTDENGRFEILKVLPGTFFIKASYLENESDLRTVVVDGDVNLEPLRLNNDAQTLNEVIVTLQKPRLERKVDRLVFNIENTALVDSEIWDVLKRTPNVMIINDKLTIKGNSAVGILINGRKINIPKNDIINLLSGTSASAVEAIEVITTPPAKYSAEDGALINIIMKKNLVAGYNGAIYNRYVQGVLPKHTIGTDHYFKGNKTDFSVNYNFGHSRDVTRNTDITNFFENGEVGSTWSAEQEYLRRRKRHNISAFFDYEINEKSNLSLSAITLWQPDIKKFFDTETDIAGDTLLSGFTTLNEADERRVNTSYHLDYERKLNEKGAEIVINGHYTFYHLNKGQLLETDFFDLGSNFIGENNFTLNSEQFINLYSLQADYSSPLGESAKIETGLRYANIASKNIIVQEGFNSNMPGIAPTEAGNFKYDESIYAAYVSYNAEWGLWELQSGLRAEYTETMGRWDVGNQNRKNDYLKLFPSFAIQYTPDEDHDFNFYGDRRISRPRYASINPFQVFQSNFSTIEGNPDLLPSTVYYAAGGYTFKNSYTVELFYTTRKDGLQELIFQDNDTRFLRFIASNVKQSSRFGIDFTINKDFTDFWDFYLLANFFEQYVAFENLTTKDLVENRQFAWFIKTSSGFTFLKDKSLTADLSFFYTAPRFSDNAQFDAFGALNLLFRKTLWNKKASISMGIEDIFNQGNQFNERNYLDQSGSSLRRAENRLFTLGFRYKFGNVKIRDNQKSNRVEERGRL